MNQKVAVTQATNGPLTWIWYLVIFALMTTLGAKMAAAVLGHGVFQALVGTVIGSFAAGGIVWLWRRIHSLIARLISGATFLAMAAASALVAQALLESRDDYTAAASAAQEPTKPNVFDQSDNQLIDKSKVVWDQPVALSRFSQEEIDRVNAALQVRNDGLNTAKVAGRPTEE